MWAASPTPSPVVKPRTWVLCALSCTLLAGAHAAAQDAAVSTCRAQTLTVKQRLALPRLRVPIGPEHPLRIAGRAAPVNFALDGGNLCADATAKDGFETTIAEGQPWAIELDGAPVDGNRRVRNVTAVRGDPARGEPLWSVVVLDVLETRIGPESVTFVDHGADGTFLTPFRDFLVRKTEGHLHPVAPVVVLGQQPWALSCDERTGTVLARKDAAFADPAVFPQWKDVLRGLFHINDIRGAMNLPPFGIHRAASIDAVAHARYCALNGVLQHEEEPGKPGYTQGGARAGMASIGSANGSVPGAIDGFLTTLLHRMPLIDPRLCEIGIGADGSQVWIEYASGAQREWAGQGPVIFPGPDRSWHEASFRGEHPDPRPAEATGAVGLPVTCAWYGGERIEHARASLQDGRTPVPCWRHWTGTRELNASMLDFEVHACLMPMRPLRHHAYDLVLTWTEEGREFRIDYGFRIGQR